MYTAATGGTLADAPSNQVVFSFTVGGLAAGDTLRLDSLEAGYDGTTAAGPILNTYRFNAYLDDAASANPVDSFRAAGQFDPVNSGTYDEPIAVGSNAAAGTTIFSNGDTFSVAFGVRENQPENSAYDNLVLNGTVISAIPEPSALSLLGFGAIANVCSTSQTNLKSHYQI